MKTPCITNNISTKLVGEEAELEKREFTEELIRDLGLPRDQAEKYAENRIEAINQTAREFGEDVESSG